MQDQSFFSQIKWGAAFTVVVLVLGLGAYFWLYGLEDAGSMSRFRPVFEGLQMKWEFGEHLDIYARAPANAMAGLRAAQGQPIPEHDTIVIGSQEAAMMARAGDLAGVGSPLQEGGVRTRVGGILQSTGTALDMLHFFSDGAFERARGEPAALFVRLTPEGEGKLFLHQAQWTGLPEDLAGNGSVLARLPFAEGAWSGYRARREGNRTLYPLVLGAEEARMMRAEGLFARSGDSIQGFFGHDVFVAGVLARTNSSADMLHIVPLGPQNW